MMTVEEAVAGRRSIRAFLPKPVPRDLIERVLTIAGRAPSGTNVQPWRVWVLQGAVRDEIARDAVARYDRNEVSKREYNYYPVKWREPYLGRRRACGSCDCCLLTMRATAASSSTSSRSPRRRCHST